jgi:hypothetical protein
MAGTLVISTLSDGTNSTSATNCISGSAKAWVNFAGSTATIRASYNVSSITRNTTGQYFVNLTNALADTNYCVQTTCAQGTATSTSSSNGAMMSSSSYPNTSSQFYVFTFPNEASATLYDMTYTYVTVFR